MQELELRKKLRRILLCDKKITEHVLGNDWNLPDLRFLKNVGPINAKKWRKKVDDEAQKKSNEDAKEVYEESKRLFSEVGESDRSLSFYTSTKAKKDLKGVAKMETLDPLLVARVVEIITNEQGSLMENKLLQMFNVLDEQTNLVKFSTILGCLGLTKSEDIDQIVMYFKYVLPKDNWFRANETETTESGVDETNSLADSQDSSVDASSRKRYTTVLLSDIELKQNASSTLVAQTDAIDALQHFVDDYHELANRRRAKVDEMEKASQDRDDSCDRDYFAQYLGVLDIEEKSVVWSELYKHMNEYYQLLNKRFRSMTHDPDGSEGYRALLTQLGEKLTSKSAGKLLIPPLTSLVAKQEKRIVNRSSTEQKQKFSAKMLRK